MGGNALKDLCETRRFDREEFFPLVDKVVAGLDELYPNGRKTLIPAYRKKESFGDADIVFETLPDVDYTNLSHNVKKFFDSKGVRPNGNVLSFEVEGLQVDLIKTAPEDFGTSLNYFAWNDLGNLMGRVAHRMGFKYGHEGLNFVFRTQDGNVFREISVTKNPRIILEFLGYDFERWAAGFDTLEEIYTFAASSKYFNPEIYSYENRNHTARVRDRKRVVYSGFLEWMERQDNLPAYPWGERMSEVGGRKEHPEFLEKAFAMSFTFQHHYECARDDLEELEDFRTKYNGEIVREVTGLDGKELGKFMRHFAEVYGESFRAVVCLVSEDSVRGMILKEFNKDRWRN